MNRLNFRVHANILRAKPDLLISMPRLKKLTVHGCSFEWDDGILECLKKADLKELNHITLKNSTFKDHFVDLIDVLSFYKLEYLQCINCENISVQELKCTLSKLPFLKCCDIAVDINALNSMAEFAELANKLVGIVNMCVNTLDKILSDMLSFTRSSYRARFPTGQKVAYFK
jgi:hypothetical protein